MGPKVAQSVGCVSPFLKSAKNADGLISLYIIHAFRVNPRRRPKNPFFLAAPFRINSSSGEKIRQQLRRKQAIYIICCKFALFAE